MLKGGVIVLFSGTGSIQVHLFSKNDIIFYLCYFKREANYPMKNWKKSQDTKKQNEIKKYEMNVSESKIFVSLIQIRSTK